MKLLILSTHTKIHRWNLRITFLNSIKSCLPGVTVDIKRAKMPEIKVVNGRIDHDWLESFKAPYLKDYNVVALHLSRAQWLKLGLQSSLRGANPKDNKDGELFYFWSDERSMRQGFHQFPQVFLHELLHSYFQTKGGEDLTHKWHDENPDIRVKFPIADLVKILK